MTYSDQDEAATTSAGAGAGLRLPGVQGDPWAGEGEAGGQVPGHLHHRQLVGGKQRFLVLNVFCNF